MKKNIMFVKHPEYFSKSIVLPRVRVIACVRVVDSPRERVDAFQLIDAVLRLRGVPYGVYSNFPARVGGGGRG